MNNIDICLVFLLFVFCVSVCVGVLILSTTFLDSFSYTLSVLGEKTFLLMNSRKLSTSGGADSLATGRQMIPEDGRGRVRSSSSHPEKNLGQNYKEFMRWIRNCGLEVFVLTYCIFIYILTPLAYPGERNF